MVSKILRRDITYKQAVMEAHESGLRLCMNRHGQFALLERPIAGWWQLSKLARLANKVMEAA